MRVICVFTVLVMVSWTYATVVIQGLGPERNFAYSFLSKGWAVINERRLQIRVEAIEDPRMIEAIALGAKRRNIYLLVDRPTELVLWLSAQKLRRLHIRWTSPQRFGLTQNYRFGYSSAMSVGDAYHTWSGPKVWRKELFAKDAELVIESGTSWQTSPKDSKDFMTEFERAIPIS